MDGENADRFADHLDAVEVAADRQAVGAVLLKHRLAAQAGKSLRVDGRLRLLQRHQAARPEVAVTFFRPDARKSGGAYVTVSGAVRKVDDVHRALVLADGTRVRVEDIFAIEGELFRTLDWQDAPKT